MGTPSQAIDYPVDRVENTAQSTDPLVLRRALLSALSDLRVDESDPAWSDGRDVIGAANERLLATSAVPVGNSLRDCLLYARRRA